MNVDETNLNAAIYALTVIKDMVDQIPDDTALHLQVEFNTVFGFLAELDEQASYHE